MWRIWVKYFDEEGKLVGYGRYWQSYKRRGNAEQVARKRYSNSKMFQYVVAQTCPWVEMEVKK